MDDQLKEKVDLDEPVITTKQYAMTPVDYLFSVLHVLYWNYWWLCPFYTQVQMKFGLFVML